MDHEPGHDLAQLPVLALERERAAIYSKVTQDTHTRLAWVSLETQNVVEELAGLDL